MRYGPGSGDVPKPPKQKPARPHHVRALKLADAKVKRERMAAQKGASAVGKLAGKSAPKPKSPASLGTASYRGHGGAAQILGPLASKPTADYPGAIFNPKQLHGNFPRALSGTLNDIAAVTGIDPRAIPRHAKELIPGTREYQRNQRRLQPGQKPEMSIGIVPGSFGKIPGVAKSAKAELKAHPIRNAFHANIDKTVADKAIATRMKQTFDREALKAAKKSGVRPGEYLDKLRGKQPEAAQKVTIGLSAGRAQALRRQQEELYHAERVRRAGAAEEAMRQTPGVAGFQAAKKELRGVLPKHEFQGLRGLTDEEANSLFTHVQGHPDLRTYEKIRVQDALRNAWIDGTVPTNSERRLLRKAFGPEFEKQLLPRTKLQKVQNIAIETANIPRSLMASFDVSAPFRQGLVAFTRHPLLAGKNLAPMIKVLGSEKGYQALMQDVTSRPTFHTMDRAGLAITDMEHSLSSREEQFMSNYAERIPGVGHVVRGSGRAYTGFLVKTRADMFDHLLSSAQNSGVELGEKGLKDLAKYVNSATGRGDLRQFERSAVGLNSIFFSPRLIASRLDFLLPWRYAGLDPFVRKQKLRAAAQFVGALGAVLWLADQVPGVKVGTDPRSTDFGKLRIGDTRVDMAGGFNQYVRLMAQIMTNQKINQATGAVQGGQGLDSTVRFIRGKLSPTSSIITDMIAHSDYANQPLTVRKEIASHFAPLVLQDAYDLFHNTGSIPKTAAGFAASATGIGVQTYPPTPHVAPKVDLETALKQEVQRYFHRDLTPQIKQALKLRDRRTQYLDDAAKKAKSDGKKFTPLDRFNAQVDLLRSLEKISDGQVRQAKSWAAAKKGAVGEHKITAEANRVADKYFGGSVLTDAGRKLRARGSQFYLGDH